MSESSLIEAYADFDKATDFMHTSLSDGRTAMEQISKRNYSLNRVFAGKDPKRVVQNGKSIKSYVQVEDKNTAHYFGAGAKLTSQNMQLLKETYTPWAMVRDSYTMDEEELDLHEGDSAERFVDIKENQVRAVYIEKFRFLEENGVFATPNAETMEESTLPAGTFRAITPWNVLVNEEANSIPSQYSKTGAYTGTGTAYNTVQRLDRSVYSAWRCQQKSYLGGPQAATSTVLPALSHMSRRCRFKGLNFSEGAYINKHSMPAVVWTGYDGYTMVEEEMRQVQNHFVWIGQQDPGYPGITIHGVPLEELEIMDEALIFPTGTSGAYSTAADATNSNGGPRFMFMDFSETGLGMILHSTKFFYKHPAVMPDMQINRRVFPYDTYANTNAISCRSSGAVYPSANIAGYSA